MRVARANTLAARFLLTIATAEKCFLEFCSVRAIGCTHSHAKDSRIRHCLLFQRSERRDNPSIWKGCDRSTRAPSGKVAHLVTDQSLRFGCRALNPSTPSGGTIMKSCSRCCVAALIWAFTVLVVPVL